MLDFSPPDLRPFPADSREVVTNRRDNTAQRSGTGTTRAMLVRNVIETVEAYWAGHLGCSSDEFHAGSSCVVRHAPALADYRGIFIFVRERSIVVSLPPGFVVPDCTRLEFWTSADARDCIRLATTFDVPTSAVIGPAMLSYADTGSLRATRRSARMLTRTSLSALAGLRAACPTLEWEYGGSAATATMAGVFERGELVAVSGYEIWGDKIAHIAAITHPAFRGRRLAQAAVSRVAAHALTSGLVPQYRILESNVPSMAVATALGFVPLATTVAVRLS